MTSNSNNNYSNSSNQSHTSEISTYFDDILRNKDMIKEMLKINISVYEDKTRVNNAQILTLKDDLNKTNSEFSIVENKLKLEYAKNHEQFQKHDINFKLLEKTLLHYRCLIKDREEEIKKYEEQSIYASQDYQNKKIKLDCINVQIIEAEFQLNTLQKKIDEKIKNMALGNNNNLDSNLTTQNENEEICYKKPKQGQENINKYIESNLGKKSSYSESFISQKQKKNNLSQREMHNESAVFDQITNNAHIAKRNKCVIF
jgi:hypothetical protein